MSSYLIRRLLLTIPVVLGVVFVVMLTMELVPGDPAEIMLGDFATDQAVQELRHELGLDRPLLVRYVEYLARVARGDLGRSLREQRPVAQEIAAAWPATFRLSLAAIVIALALGIPAGVISATQRYSWFDNLSRVLSLLGLSMPVFWTGILLIVFFSYKLRLFPVGGHGTWRHLVLPAFTLALPSLAMLARMTRSSLLEVLSEDYIRTARAKGLMERVVIYRHALRNALIPIVTVAGLQMGQMLGGAILTETVFSWPGLGRLMVRAIFNRDFVLLQGAVLVFALAFVLINLLVDISYSFLDPRVARR
ncbi:MAG: ABC transporter permease [Anaerolineae bacterium]